MILFLDIDGVMIPANSWRKLELLEDGFPEFSAKATKSFNKIMSKSNADIILTTSHKSNYSLKKWKAIFKRRGIQLNKINKLPENSKHLNRKDELLNWFQTNSITDNFIIIDDDKSLNGLPDNLKDKLIQTSASVGLTDSLADKALALFEKLKYESVE